MSCSHLEVQQYREDLAKTGISATDIKSYALEKSSNGELDIIRTAIQAVLLLNPDELDGFFGIKIVQRTQERPLKEDCIRYAFGELSLEHAIESLKMVIAGTQIERTPNAYAVYVDQNKTLRHVGRVSNGGNIISKWGFDGHIYLHEPLYVPISYGTDIVYFPPNS